MAGVQFTDTTLDALIAPNASKFVHANIPDVGN
jgi:hypothetical protein